MPIDLASTRTTATAGEYAIVAGGRFEEMDVIRGAMAFMVLLFHYSTRYDELYGFAQPPSWRIVDGEMFVLVFFALSGYFLLMLGSRVHGVADYLVSRFSRLFPAYWAAMLVSYAAISAFGLPGRERTASELAANLSMLQEYFAVPHVDGAYWSLTLEITFYGAILLLLLTRQVHRAPLWIACGLATCVAAWIIEQFGIALPWRLHLLALLDTFPFFALGMGFYLLVTTPTRRRHLLTLTAAMVAMLVRSTWPERAVAPLVCALFYLAVQGRLQWIVNPLTVFLGIISYPLYLVHQNVGYIVIRNAQAHGWSGSVSIVLAIAVSLLLASVLSFAVERPAMAAIRRWWRRRRQYRARAQISHP